MADDKKEPWLNWLALTTIVLAVCATLSTARGGAYSTRSVLNQTLAANQWSYYQSKSIKGYLYEVEKQKLETEMAADGDAWPARRRELFQALAQRYGTSITRYAAERDTIQAQARTHEAVRDHAQRHARIFSDAVIFLQIGILLSSVAALLRRRPLWYLGSLSGLVGLYWFVMGFVAR